jgi:hypothetical protein
VIRLFIGYFVFLMSLHPGELSLDYTVRVQSRFFTTDYFGNVYLITGKGLFKYDPSGKLVHQYNPKIYGNPTTVDVTNPFKPLVYFKDFGVLHYLDSKLSLRSEIKLGELDIWQPGPVSASEKEGIWVFDSKDLKLKKIEKDLRISFESVNLNQITQVKLNPIQIIESGNLIFMNNVSGILVFDNFGSYLSSLHFQAATHISATENELYLTIDSKLIRYRLKELITDTIQLPAADSVYAIEYKTSKVYLAAKNSFSVYSR